MTRLDNLLDFDNENAQLSKRALTEIEPTSLEVVEKFAFTLDCLTRSFGTVCNYDKHHKVIEDWAKSLGLKGNKALEFLRNTVVVGSNSPNDPTTRAKAEFHNAVAILARAHIALRLGRDFLFGITDMLRLRITPSLGILRMQSESAGQLRLLVNHPELGEDWFASAREDQGKVFHKKWHSKIVSVIRDFDIYTDYSRGSNMSLHTRASGTTLGTLIGAKDAAKRGEIRLNYQEADDARILFFWFGVFLRFHRKLLIHTSELFPELTERHIEDSRLHEFFTSEANVWKKTGEVHKALDLTEIHRIFHREQV